jgi:hypothetical protein
MYMGVSRTQQQAGRGGKLRARPQFARRYQPFVPPPGVSAGEVGRSHLNWVLANLDRLTLEGRANPNTIGLAIQRDLALLAQAPEPAPAAPAAAVQPELAELERKYELLQQAYVDVFCQASEVSFKLFGFIKELGDDVMRRPEVKASYLDLHTQLQKIRYQRS